MKLLDPRFQNSSRSRFAASWILGLALAGWTADVHSPRLEAASPPDLRWRWSNPTPHGANVRGMARGQGLTVQVGERGQIYTSADLTVWEPRTSSTRHSLRSVTFMGHRLLISGEAGTVLYSTNFEDYVVCDLQTADWLEGITASTNLAVAVGDNGAIYTSREGLSWHRQNSGTTRWLRSVAYGGGHFVAVGKDGLVLTSPNGTNWTKGPMRTTSHLNGVAWSGTGFYVAADLGQYLTSPVVPTQWFLNFADTTNSLQSVAGFASQFLLMGTNELRFSQDGETWLDQTDPQLPMPAPTWTYLSATALPGDFFVAGRSGMMVEGYRTNQVEPFQWFVLSPSLRNWLWEVKRLPDFYITVGHRGTIMTSENGRVWNLEYTPPSAQGQELLGVGGTTNLLVAVGSQGTILLSPNTLTNLVLTNSNDQLVTNTASTLGVFWHAVDPPPTTADLQGVAHWDGCFVVCGENATILTSPDGTNWTAAPNAAAPHSLSGVAGFPGGFVAVGTNGVILVSEDGEYWLDCPSPTDRWLLRVRWVEDRLLALGEEGALLSSSNGHDWVSHVTGARAWLSDAIRIGDGYYISGFQGTVLYTEDLETFSDLTAITKKSLLGLAHDGSQLLAVGVEGSILRAALEPKLDAVTFLDYDRVDGQNLFLIDGDPDQRIAIERTRGGQSWTRSRVFEFLDETGTLLILEDPTEDEPDGELYRAVTLP